MEDRATLPPAGVCALTALALGAVLALRGALGRRRAARAAEILLGVGLGALALALRLHAPVAAAGTEALAVRVVEAPARDTGGCRLRVYVHGPRPGGALVRSPETGCALLPGGLALARLELGPLRPASNPGGSSPRRRWARRGVRAQGRVTEGRIVAVEPAPRGAAARLERLRRRAGDAVHPPARATRAGALLRALVTGRRDRLDAELAGAFERSGTAHLLAVSGLHVGWVFAVTQICVGWALRRVPGVAVARRARPAALAAGACVAVGYAALAGFGLPALRATAMAAAGTLAVLGGRPGTSLNALALAALTVLAVDPGSLFEPAFALSFSAVAGILAWSPPAGRAAALAHASLAASLATAPWVAALGAPLPAGALLANLLAVPWFGAVVVPAGLGTAALGLASAELAAVARPLAELAAGLGIALVERLESANLLEATARPVATAVALAAAVFALRLAVLARTVAALGLAALSIGAHLHATRAPPPDPRAPTALFLDVGHGDAALLRSGSSAWLIDAGARLGRFDAGRRIVLPALRAEGVRALDALVVTHADRDHLGGARAVIEALPVAELWLGPGTWRSPAAVPLRRAAAQRGVPLRIVTAGHASRRKGISLEVLWPPAGTSARRNAASVVLRARFTHGCVMLPGDVPARVERALARGLEPCSVLKLAHHGSRSSSAPEWLRALRPELAIASSGVRPRSPLPHPEVRARLRAGSVTLYETARTGALRVRFTATGPLAEPHLPLPLGLQSGAHGAPTSARRP